MSQPALPPMTADLPAKPTGIPLIDENYRAVLPVAGLAWLAGAKPTTSVVLGIAFAAWQKYKGAQ